MTVFDAHCDTLQKITDSGEDLLHNSYHVDIERIIEMQNKYVQVFAAFINKEQDVLPPFLRCRQLIDKYFEEVKKNNSSICHCNSSKEVKKALEENKIASLLSIEGGEAFEGKLENLHCFYNQGVRIVTLTWNFSNELCDGIEVNQKGLSDFGKKVVSEMNSLGMLIDVSHISEKGFWDVLENSKKPIAATHSNAREICPHRRNLSDEQICAIIKNGGCIGINLYPPFLSESKSTVKNVVEHIEHILSLGGENNIGLGCDFDGVDILPEGISGVKDLSKLFDELQRLGYADLLIKKLSSDNFLNLTEKILI